MGLRIERIPTLRDNYTFLAYCENTREGIVIDAAEADPVVVRLEALGICLTGIFSTHHHLDHTAGNQDLARLTGAPVLAHFSNEGRLPNLSRGLTEGDEVHVGESIGRVLEIPGHTLDQLALVFDEIPAVFCGDTLFAGGCGRIFEGTAELMFTALHDKLGKLPNETLIYCGHEYTEANLRFAAEIEPDDEAIAERLAKVESIRKEAASDWHNATPAEMTIPSTLAEERATNLFLRAITVEELARIRALKDQW